MVQANPYAAWFHMASQKNGSAQQSQKSGYCDVITRTKRRTKQPRQHQALPVIITCTASLTTSIVAAQ